MALMSVASCSRCRWRHATSCWARCARRKCSPHPGQAWWSPAHRRWCSWRSPAGTVWQQIAHVAVAPWLPAGDGMLRVEEPPPAAAAAAGAGGAGAAIGEGAPALGLAVSEGASGGADVAAAAAVGVAAGGGRVEVVSGSSSVVRFFFLALVGASAAVAVRDLDRRRDTELPIRLVVALVRRVSRASISHLQAQLRLGGVKGAQERKRQGRRAKGRRGKANQSAAQRPAPRPCTPLAVALQCDRHVSCHTSLGSISRLIRDLIMSPGRFRPKFTCS